MAKGKFWASIYKTKHVWHNNLGITNEGITILIPGAEKFVGPPNNLEKLLKLIFVNGSVQNFGWSRNNDRPRTGKFFAVRLIANIIKRHMFRNTLHFVTKIWYICVICKNVVSLCQKFCGHPLVP